MIDIHSHLEQSLERFIAHMDWLGAEKAWALSLEEPELKAFSCPTSRALDAAKKYPDRVIPFCHVNVRANDAVKQIEKYAAAGCKGFGEHKMHIAIDDPAMDKIYAICNELKWPFLYHFQEKGQNGGYSWGIEKFAKIIEKYTDIKFIGHAGSWWDYISADADGADAMPEGRIVIGGLIDTLLADYENVYADFSAGSGCNALTRDVDFMKEFIVRHRKKLMFGSDCPCPGDGSEYCYGKAVLAGIKVVVEDDGILVDILHNNAAGLIM
jgi:predicted TIM-barrel fold metal-dependent hydrolase